MSATTAAASTLARSVQFYDSSLGKKVVMAVTGCILFLFVIGHMLGNLQIYLGPEVINEYAKKLRDLGPLLWLIRGALLLTVVLHIVAAVQLWQANRAARPQQYVKQNWVHASYASRTMLWSGPLLAAFIIYHLLHFTTGQAHPNFNHELNVYANVVKGFQQIPASIAYIVAMGFLGLHLVHGVWSMFQSVGVNHPRYTPILKKFALLSTIVIVLGNISIPIAVMLGLVS